MTEELHTSGTSADIEVPDAPTDEPGSVRAMLRERWEAIEGQKTLDLEIPGVPGDVLRVRYRALPNDELVRLQKRAQKPGVSPVAANADTLVRCCQAILVPVSADEEAPLDTLTDDEGDPIVFDKRLADFLGFGEEVETAREVVYRLFSKAPQPDMAIGAQGVRVLRWMGGASEETASELLGF